MFSSGGVIDLKKYQLLGVREVWFWQNNQITFFKLIDNEYKEITNSSCLSRLTSQFLAGFINRGLSESPLSIEADFISNLP